MFVVGNIVAQATGLEAEVEFCHFGNVFVTETNDGYLVDDAVMAMYCPLMLFQENTLILCRATLKAIQVCYMDMWYPSYA